MASAREEMILSNLPLVSFVVARMGDQSSSTIEREDAIAYGIEGLIQAVDNFDSSRGTTFASFAVRRIRGSILDAIRRMDILPRSLRRSARELERANLELASKFGRWATPQELSSALGLTLQELRSVMGHTGSRVVSLEKVMEERADGIAGWDTTDPDEFGDPAAAVDHKASLHLLDEAIDSLPARDQQIIRMRYGRSMPFHEIGKEMELSESRVCQLHKRILTGLRVRLRKEMDSAA